MTDYVLKVTNLKDMRAQSRLRDKQALQLMTEELLKRRQRKLASEIDDLEEGGLSHKQSGMNESQYHRSEMGGGGGGVISE